jgi:hypothetical protein
VSLHITTHCQIKKYLVLEIYNIRESKKEWAPWF